MKVFIDIGAHHGQSSEVALDPKFGFDFVIAFEPSKASFNRLSKLRHPKLQVHNLGLGNRTRQTLLYGAGELGASIFELKKQLLAEQDLRQEKVQIVSAAEQLGFILTETNEVFLKMNCEGSEVEVLESLLKAKMLPLVDFVYVDFDIKKVVNQEGVAQYFEKMLQDSEIKYVTPELLNMGGSEGVRKWLMREVRQVQTRPAAVIKYHLKLHLPLKLRFYSFARLFIPKLLRRRVFHLIKNSTFRKWLLS